jgi:dolichol-phosphate mannosyltransferase
MTGTSSDASGQVPGGNGVALSFIVPCYNERDVIGHTIPPLWAALSSSIGDVELILVDNGSTDGTADVIAELCALDPRIRVARVPENRGYGLGVLTGYRAARGRCLGHLPADGPVTPEDVALLACRALAEGPNTIVSAVRRTRQDTLVRRVVSRSYNLFFRVLFGPLTDDVNGTPKFLFAKDVERMRLRSEDYFLEAEMMIKARQMGMRTLAIEVLSRPRAGGKSKVSARLIAACGEFVWNLVRARLGALSVVAALLGPMP